MGRDSFIGGSWRLEHRRDVTRVHLPVDFVLRNQREIFPCVVTIYHRCLHGVQGIRHELHMLKSHELHKWMSHNLHMETHTKKMLSPFIIDVCVGWWEHVTSCTHESVMWMVTTRSHELHCSWLHWMVTTRSPELHCKEPRTPQVSQNSSRNLFMCGNHLPSMPVWGAGNASRTSHVYESQTP